MQVLSDNEKRSLYDRFGDAGLQGEYGAGPQGVRAHFLLVANPSLMLVHA